MKRRSFLQGILGGGAVAVVMPTAAKEEVKPFVKPGKFGFVRVDHNVRKGDFLFCSSREGGTIDAWVTTGDKWHAVALHEVDREKLRDGARGIQPAQFTVAVKFV